MSNDITSVLVDRFVRIIDETLATTPVSYYVTTALLVDHRGNIEFEMIVNPEELNTCDPRKAAYELGKVLASRRAEIAAVLVAEQLLQASYAPAIVISVGGPNGYRNSVLLPLTRLSDGTLRLQEASASKPLTTVANSSTTAGKMFIQGFSGKEEDGPEEGG